MLYGLPAAFIVLTFLPLPLAGISSGRPDSFAWFVSREGTILTVIGVVGVFLLIYLTQRYGTAYCRLRGTRLIFGRWAPFEIEIDNIRAIEIRAQMGSVLSLDTSHGLGIILEEPVVYRGSRECRWSTRLKLRSQHCHVFFPDLADKTPQELGTAIARHAWSMGAGAPPMYARDYAGRRRLPTCEYLSEHGMAQQAELEADPEGDPVCCRGCGYDLRASLASIACPECGHPVALSMQAESLALADSRWLKSMRAGALLFSVAAVFAAGAAVIPALFAAAALDGAISGRQMIMLTSWSWAMILLPVGPAVYLLGRRDPTIQLLSSRGAVEPWLRRIAWGVFLASAVVLKTASATMAGMIFLGWMIALVALCGLWRVRALLLLSGSHVSATVAIVLQFLLSGLWIMIGAGMLCVGIMAMTGAAVGPTVAAPPRAAPTDSAVLIYLVLPEVGMCAAMAVLASRAAVMVRRELGRRRRLDAALAGPPTSESGSPTFSL